MEALLLAGLFGVPLVAGFTWGRRDARARLRRPAPVPGAAAQVRARMIRSHRTTLLLEPTTGPGFSKLGGQPDLPADRHWPHGDHTSLAFLAQIDLNALQDEAWFDWLPADGTIYAFYDHRRLGSGHEVALVYGSGLHGAPRAFPSDLPDALRFQERRIGFKAYASVPSLDWLDVDLACLDAAPAELNALAEGPDLPFGPGIQHRIGGYPSEIHGGRLQVECEYIHRGLRRDPGAPVPSPILHAARAWRMILQIDSDRALGMNWGGGRLYVFGRARDLRKGDFSRTVTIWQTH